MAVSKREHTTVPKQILMTWNIIWVIKHTLCLQCKSITIGSWEICKITRIKIPLNNRYFKEISAKENREHFEFGENKDSPCQNSRGAAKSVLRGKFIATRSKELWGPLFKLLILCRAHPKSYWSMWPFCDDKGLKPMQLSCMWYPAISSPGLSFGLQSYTCSCHSVSFWQCWVWNPGPSTCQASPPVNYVPRPCYNVSCLCI